VVLKHQEDKEQKKHLEGKHKNRQPCDARISQKSQKFKCIAANGKRHNKSRPI
jgi:hypothetical protein